MSQASRNRPQLLKQPRGGVGGPILSMPLRTEADRELAIQELRRVELNAVRPATVRVYRYQPRDY